MLSFIWERFDVSPLSNFQQRSPDYNKVLDQYPRLQQGRSGPFERKVMPLLLELGQRMTGVKELRSLIYPVSPKVQRPCMPKTSFQAGACGPQPLPEIFPPRSAPSP